MTDTPPDADPRLAAARDHLRGVALGLAALFGPLTAAKLLLEASQRLTADIDTAEILPVGRGGTA